MLEYPDIVKDPEKLRAAWNKVYYDARNSDKIAFGEEEMIYHEVGIYPDASQFLETRKYQ